MRNKVIIICCIVIAALCLACFTALFARGPETEEEPSISDTILDDSEVTEDLTEDSSEDTEKTTEGDNEEPQGLTIEVDTDYGFGPIVGISK